MKVTAAVLDQVGSEFTLKTLDLADPGPGEVLIEVNFAGVNRPDIFQRMGAYPPPPGASPILGLELSGADSRLSPCGWPAVDRPGSRPHPIS